MDDVKATILNEKIIIIRGKKKFMEMITRMNSI